MTEPATPASPNAPPMVVAVFDAADLYVTHGVNRGDGLGELPDLCAGDIYELDPGAAPLPLALAPPPAGPMARMQVVAAGSAIGRAGDPVVLAGQLTLMAPDGDPVTVLLVRHRAAGQASARLYALPLVPLAPRVEYTLVAAEDAPATARLADFVCLSFLRGTR
ncbi:MAG: hypothetical protein ACK4OP_17050, partial [Gemmobacter sp.]